MMDQKCQIARQDMPNSFKKAKQDKTGVWLSFWIVSL